MTHKIYLSEKEASIRYSLSPAWFQRMRWSGNGPLYIKVNRTGKVLYPIESTDAFFESFSLQQSTSILQTSSKTKDVSHG